MQQVGEPVDHRHVGVLRQLLDVLVRERADHDAVDVARQHARRVGDRLAAAELHVARREKERVSAELVGADLERDARARARLHEDHRERLSRERLLVVRAGAHPLGEREQAVELVAGEVGNGEKVAWAFGRVGRVDRWTVDRQLARLSRMYFRRSSSSTIAFSGRGRRRASTVIVSRAAIGELEQHVLEQRRHHGVQAARADVLHALVHQRGDARDLGDAVRR